ncbi:hypothetical protein PTH_2510 [Pelotomaculum thermopropionicum SI]|uniref:Uncharacterized protein n=1 Tax=Pelotomaculum thermopropionicum (strain DSM 13744 / JCM 10971 / SI) TaxID=370438 RepID=A5CZ85_PELTS|nr:hypothetical protein PTH_2510 [Pelotomaculum thermopropionicum SI]
MKLNLKPKINIAKLQSGEYTGIEVGIKIASNKKEEAIDMTQFVQKIRSISLPPHQLRELGLTEGWQKKIPAQYIEKVVKAAERFKEDLRELSKR